MEQTEVGKKICIDKLKATRKTSYFIYCRRWLQPVADGFLSTILLAVCDHVEDILEHLDSVQVSEETRESKIV